MAFPVDPCPPKPTHRSVTTVPPPTQPDDLPGLSEARRVEQLAGAKRGSGRRWRAFSPSGQLTACLLFLPPALVVFTMFVTLPVLEAAYYSFFNWNGYGAPSKWVNLDNFVRVWRDPIFHHSLLNNLWVVLVSAVVQVPLALGLALLISDKRRSSVVFRAIFFLPYILGEVVAGLIWRYMYDGNYGVVAVVFRWFGQEAPQVLATEGWAEAALLLVVVWKYFGFHMALFIAGRQGVPDDVIESAQIDGASRWQTTLHIVLPLMRPVVVLSLFFSLLGSLQFFDMIIPLTGGGPSNSTHSAVSYLYTFGIQRMRVGFGSAVGVTLFVICVLVMVFYKRLFMREKATR
jgi:raffinose/stachyose/melibiose transport system permease protein